MTLAIEGGPAIIIADPLTNRDVREGRAVCQHVRHLVQEHIARGKRPSEVWVSVDTARKMQTFFEARCEPGTFDGVLPPMVLGVPMRIGATGGDDVRLLFDGTSSSNS